MSDAATTVTSIDVQRVPIGTIRDNPRHARTHSKRQIQKIAESIKTFGFLNPILVDESRMVMAGHGRLQAAKLLKHTDIPTLRIEGLSEAKKRAYVLADNQLAKMAGWNMGLLAAELGELAVLLPEIDLDVTITGFEAAEIDLLSRFDEVPAPDAEETKAQSAQVTRRGDVWLLGLHRLLCGDARSGSDLDRMMAGSDAKMMFADPPYNVPIAGHVQGRGRVKHAEFAFAVGEMRAEEFTNFLRTALEQAARVSMPGALHYVCMDWRHIVELLQAGQSVYHSVLNICVWSKTNAGQGSFYRSQHEFIVVFRVGTNAHQNNVMLGRFGRNRSNLWTYPGVNSFGTGRDEALAAHPTVKPVPLVADIMRDCTTRGDLVLDPFLGSGTTLLAAETLGRRCYGLDYEPSYIDVAIRRWQAMTGRDAIRESDNVTFDDAEAASTDQPKAEAIAPADLLEVAD